MKRSDSELLKSLQGFQQELQSAGTLNGTARSASRDLAEARQRGIELSTVEPLKKWDAENEINFCLSSADS